MNRKLAKAVLFGLPAIVFLACTGADGESDNADEPKNIGKPDVTVKAGAILKEFEANELAADEKYKGKVLKVSGKVAKVDTDFLDEDTYILQVGTGSDFEVFTVNCNGAPKDQLASLKPGDPVTVIGAFDDGGDLGIELDDCRVA